METRSQVQVGTTPCVCGMRPPAIRCAHSQGIRLRSKACRFHPMAPRSQVEVGTTPCVCGMRPPAVRCARSPGIRIGSSACRFHPMETRSQVQVGDRTVRLWDATTGSPLRTLTGHTGGVYSVSFSPDGNTLASASRDNTVRLWDANTGSLAAHAHRAYVCGSTACRFHPMETRSQVQVVDNTVRLWDATTGSPLRTLTGHTASVYSVSFSPDGNTLASGSHGTTPCVCGMRTPAVRCARSQGIRLGSAACRFHPMETRSQVQVGDNTVRLWDATTGSPLRTLTGHTGGVIQRVVFTRWKHARKWKCGPRPCVCGMRTPAVRSAHSQGIRLWSTSVSFSPDSNTLASGGFDNTVRLWDATTGSPLRTLTGHTD